MLWVRACVYCLNYPAYSANAPYYIALCGLSGYTIISPHCITNGMIFGKKLLNTKRMFWFSVQLLSETFLIISRTERDVTINYIGLHVHYRLLLLDCNILQFSRHVFERSLLSNLMKIRPVGAEFHAHRRTDGQVESNNLFFLPVLRTRQNFTPVGVKPCLP